MSSYNHILVEFSSGVKEIALNRPDKLNSFNAAMAAELLECLQQAAGDAQVRCILLRGEGRGFCAGQDLMDVLPSDKNPKPDLGEVVKRQYNPIILAIRNAPKPVVCAVNGVAAGAGANLAFCCDIIVAAKEANFIQSFAKVGLIPDSAGTYFLPRLIGLQRAAALTMLADKISAEEACRLGLVHKVFEGDNLLPEARKISAYLATQPTKGLALTKQAFNQTFLNGLEEQLALEEKLQREAGQSSDYQEGVRAFLEKRNPNFTGR
ncbi:MAG: 2-(1,2-epoxy-1,2-dihydrophenyl)acetyl-CoA isomerase [Proteobacteria bacterium]|nr:MAG: 2-(1,2-epoxy-1,2-dihydrophenyl)acetyl-CoA isomerase [Pseudomonadota bacterium]